MAMMSDVDLPAAHVRSQVAAAIDVVVQLARLRDGRRVVWEIAVVEGTRRGEPVVEPVFRFRPRDGGAGRFSASGMIPALVDVLRQRGEGLDDVVFAVGEDAA
jgi:pilus assembly protein CpaF